MSEPAALKAELQKVEDLLSMGFIQPEEAEERNIALYNSYGLTPPSATNTTTTPVNKNHFIYLFFIYLV